MPLPANLPVYRITDLPILENPPKNAYIEIAYDGRSFRVPVKAFALYQEFSHLLPTESDPLEDSMSLLLLSTVDLPTSYTLPVTSGFVGFSTGTDVMDMKTVVIPANLPSGSVLTLSHFSEQRNTCNPVPIKFTFERPIYGLPFARGSGHNTSFLLFPTMTVMLRVFDTRVQCLSVSSDSSWLTIPESQVPDWYRIYRRCDNVVVGPNIWDRRECRFCAEASGLQLFYRFRYRGGAFANTTNTFGDFYLWRLPSILEWLCTTEQLSYPSVLLPPGGSGFAIDTIPAVPAGNIQNDRWMFQGAGTGDPAHLLLFPHLVRWTAESSTRYGYEFGVHGSTYVSGELRYVPLHAWGVWRSNPPTCGFQEEVDGSFAVTIPLVW